MSKLIRTALGVAGILAMAAPVAAAQGNGDGPNVLYAGSWLCVTPEAYDEAKRREREWPAEKLRGLEKALLDEKLCMAIDEDEVEDMLAPFVVVTDEKGDKVRVQYEVEYYHKKDVISGSVSQVRFVGWTARENLRNYYEWANNLPPKPKT